MKHRAENYFGWYGVAAILLAYALLNADVIQVKSVAYQLLNLTGALGIVGEALSKKDMQPAILNGIWAIIAVLALINVAVH